MLGTLGKVNLVWALSDMFNGFMVIPNLIALFLLRGEIKAVYDVIWRKCARARRWIMIMRCMSTTISSAEAA